MGTGAPDRNERGEQEWIDIELFLRPPLLAGIVGESSSIKEVVARIERLAGHQGTVLIQGESGTGKEAVAHALHQLGSGSSGPLISFNCSNLVEGLAESQLFGHVKGAFTDAREAHAGCFRQANGGTLLLDEIGELPLAMQAKLLRVTETFEIQAVGSPQAFHVDLRLIAATNRDLRKMAAGGEFRADLFYRLDVGSIQVPPMRERLDDVTMLTAHFVERFNRAFGKRVEYLSRRALDLLCSYQWPGNVRELAHTIERAILLTDDDRIDVDDLPDALVAPTSEAETSTSLPSALASPGDNVEPSVVGQAKASPHQSVVMTLEDAMKVAVQRSLEFARGDCARAARLLGISRPAIYRKMARYGITSASLRQLREQTARSAADGGQ